MEGGGGRLGLLLLILIAVVATGRRPDPAFAATIGCGQCHGIYKNNPFSPVSTISGVKSYEDINTPQTDNLSNGLGRGLHGIHMDYSSVSFGMNGSKRGNCNYCHNQNVHETGFVTFSGTSPQSRQKTSSVGLKGNVSGTGIGSNGIDITLMDGTATCTKACHKGTSALTPPRGKTTRRFT